MHVRLVRILETTSLTVYRTVQLVLFPSFQQSRLVSVVLEQGDVPRLSNCDAVLENVQFVQLYLTRINVAKFVVFVFYTGLPIEGARPCACFSVRLII